METTSSWPFRPLKLGCGSRCILIRIRMQLSRRKTRIRNRPSKIQPDPDRTIEKKSHPDPTLENQLGSFDIKVYIIDDMMDKHCISNFHVQTGSESNHILRTGSGSDQYTRIRIRNSAINSKQPFQNDFVIWYT